MKAGYFFRYVFLVIYWTSEISSCFAKCGNGIDVTTNFKDFPASIQTLPKEIEGKTADDVRAAIIKRFGQAVRDVGSGVSIEQWDIESGVLTYSRGLASFYWNGRNVWVTQTANKLMPTLTENMFEMYTMPEPQMKYWIGDVTLKRDGSFGFVDSSQNLDHRTNQSRNFFIKHPTGRFAIRFSTGCSNQTILERVSEGALLCTLTFSPADGSPQAMYDVVAYPSERRLEFRTKARPPSFLLEKSW